jgi:hypothetical protein
MKKLIQTVLAAALLAVFMVSPAAAAPQGPPVGSCPAGLELHHIMEHHNHGHNHVGLEADLNQDGLICVKHLANNLHVHADNVLP